MNDTEYFMNSDTASSIYEQDSNTDSLDFQSCSQDQDQDEVSGSSNIYLSERIERSRERNRIHAKKTRERKKAALDSLKSQLLGLQDEVIIL